MILGINNINKTKYLQLRNKYIKSPVKKFPNPQNKNTTPVAISFILEPKNLYFFIYKNKFYLITELF